MADGKKKRAPQDAKRISLEDYEVAYWTGKYGVTRHRLEEVVKKVGNSADRVGEELKRR